MNSPSPLQPISPLSQPPGGKSNVRIAVITIIALHAVFFGGLLLQGCKPKTTGTTGTNATTAASVSTNFATDLAPLTNAAYPELTNLQFSSQTTTQRTTESALTPTNVMPQLQPITTPTEPPSGMTEYTVQKGDVPAQIAKKHGVSLSALMKANPGLEPRKLKVGQRIQIPAAAPKASAETANGTTTEEPKQVHVVKSGDNLTRIARQHNLTVKELRMANNLKTDRIQVGQRLKIPAAKGTAPAPTNSEQGANGTVRG